MNFHFKFHFCRGPLSFNKQIFLKGEFFIKDILSDKKIVPRKQSYG